MTPSDYEVSDDQKENDCESATVNEKVEPAEEKVVDEAEVEEMDRGEVDGEVTKTYKNDVAKIL